MATLKYKTPEGEWKKVSIGGGGSTEEVYVGSDAPTDENVKVWIDPQGTPSSPSQPSAGVEVIDNLESDSTTAALSANQGRVLKEMMLLIREIQPVVDGMEYTQEQQEYNVETYRIMSSGKAIAWYVMGYIVIPTGQGYHSSKGHYYSCSNVDFTKIDVSKKIASLECERIYLYSDGKAEQQILETVSISLK